MPDPPDEQQSLPCGHPPLRLPVPCAPFPATELAQLASESMAMMYVGLTSDPKLLMVVARLHWCSDPDRNLSEVVKALTTSHYVEHGKMPTVQDVVAAAKIATEVRGGALAHARLRWFS